MIEYRNHAAVPRTAAPLDLVHSDLAGPISPCSKEGSKYAMIFTDDYCGVMFLYFLRNKSDATRATARFFADIAPYGRVKRLRSDQGGEYISKEFQDLIISNRIRHEMSAPYSSHQNGRAQRGAGGRYLKWHGVYYCRQNSLSPSGTMHSKRHHIFETNVSIKR